MERPGGIPNVTDTGGVMHEDLEAGPHVPMYARAARILQRGRELEAIAAVGRPRTAQGGASAGRSTALISSQSRHCGVEKRQHPRIDCRIESRLRIAHQEVVAVVRNVSQGGLAVQAAVEPAERGEVAYLKLLPRRGLEIELAVLLWHFKRLRKVSTGESVTQIGVVLASGSEPYFDLVRSLQRTADAAGEDLPTPRRVPPAASVLPPQPQAAGSERVTPPPSREAVTAEAAEAPGSDSRPARAADPEPSGQYAVRVKQRGGSRSCKLVVGGVSVEDAKERALAEIGDGWTVLEAKPV